MKKITNYCLAIFLSCFALSAGAIDLVNVSSASTSNGKARILMQFDGVPNSVSSYQIGSPAQVVVDIPYANTSRYDTVNLPKPLKNISFINTDDQLRAIVSMNAAYNHELIISGSQVFIDIDVGKDFAAGNQAHGSNHSNAQLNAYSVSKTQVDKIDFKKRSEDSGEVIIYSGDNTVAEIERAGGRVELVLRNTQLPARYSKKFDVDDFGTPIKYFTARQVGNDVKVVVYPEGEYEYFGYQASDFYSINVTAISEEEVARIKEEKKEYIGEKLNFNFQAIPVRQALQIIADIQNKNLVVGDSVNGEVTLRLVDVPWDQALDLILTSNNLAKVEKGNILFIAPKDELLAQETAKLQSKKEIEELEPLRTEFFAVNYAKAEELLRLIREAKFSSDRGTALADQRTNTLIISDTEDKLDSIRQMLKKVDVSVKQVLIEGRMVLANEDFTEALGVNWNILNAFTNQKVSVQNSSVDLSAPGANSLLTLGISDLASGLLDLEISAQATAGNGEIISSPKILTSDKQQASISSGTQIPFTTVSQNGTNVQFIDAVLSLNVTPQITPEGSIIMDIDFTNDTPQQISTGEFVIDTNQLTTQVLVDNGQTVVLGGIFSQEQQESVAKTPLLGDIPLIGGLFRRTVESTGKRELLIFITPKLVDKDAF